MDKIVAHINEKYKEAGSERVKSDKQRSTSPTNKEYRAPKDMSLFFNFSAPEMVTTPKGKVVQDEIVEPIPEVIVRADDNAKVEDLHHVPHKMEVIETVEPARRSVDTIANPEVSPVHADKKLESEISVQVQTGTEPVSVKRNLVSLETVSVSTSTYINTDDKTGIATFEDMGDKATNEVEKIGDTHTSEVYEKSDVMPVSVTLTSWDGKALTNADVARREISPSKLLRKKQRFAKQLLAQIHRESTHNEMESSFEVSVTANKKS